MLVHRVSIQEHLLQGEEGVPLFPDFLTDPSVLTRILDHLKLPSSPPRLAPARSRIDEQDLFAKEEPSDPAYQEEIDPCDGGPSAKAPP